MMLRYYLALLVLFSNSTWGQDSMSLITEGEYRPLYLSADSPLMKVSAFLLDKKPVTNRDFYQFLSTNIQWQRDMVPLLFAENSYLSHWQKIDDQYTPKSEDLKTSCVCFLVRRAGLLRITTKTLSDSGRVGVCRPSFHAIKKWQPRQTVLSKNIGLVRQGSLQHTAECWRRRTELLGRSQSTWCNLGMD